MIHIILYIPWPILYSPGIKDFKENLFKCGIFCCVGFLDELARRFTDDLAFVRGLVGLIRPRTRPCSLAISLSRTNEMICMEFFSINDVIRSSPFENFNF